MTATIVTLNHHIGFTGTRHDMSIAQATIFVSMLPMDGWLHHGDCEGSDKRAHGLARKHTRLKIALHPPTDSTLRAWCDYDRLLPAEPYLTRNRAIVDQSTELYATPAEREEQIRGGTWYTIRYARKQGKLVTIIYPDGTIEHSP